MISIVGTVGLPSCYGGFETLVENLVFDNIEDITVYCSSKNYAEQPKEINGTKLVYIPISANGPQSVFYDVFSLIHCIFTKPKTVLILGVSGCIFLPVFRLLSNAKVVTNIDGLEWKRNKWGKFTKKFLKLSEYVAVKFSDTIISDNKSISDYVMSEYSVKSPVIAYGGDHAVSKTMQISDGGFALALCRIEPENNVDMILSAFSKTSKKLKFIGNWNNSSFGRGLRTKYKSFTNIEMIDPIYDIIELSAFRSSCSFYVHGHSAGGTNPSLVEMMHFGKSILCFDCSYNRCSTEDKAEFFADATELVDIIESTKFPFNGEFMLDIAKRRYTWGKVREDYFSLLD